MKLHEYQAKSLFKTYGIPTESYELAHTPEQAVQLFKSKELDKAVLKAQVLSGGRGKAGGVKLVNDFLEAEDYAKEIFKRTINGLPVTSLLVSEAVSIYEEYYISFTLDRNIKSVILILSKAGGVDIEEVAKDRPEQVLRIPIDPFIGVLDFKAKEYAYQLSSNYHVVQQIAPIIQKLYILFLEKDASLVEINPLVLTKEGRVLAIDGKVAIDDNSKYRQPEIVSWYQPTKSEIVEAVAKEKGFSYIQLNGSIGCMVNGAGLAMATMDLIQLNGGTSANFLDIGGSSNPQKVIHAMHLLLSDKNVKVVLINIFGGITRCDDVARGLLEAFDSINVSVPVIVRLTGTNEVKGREMLEGSQLIVANSMDEATILAVQQSQS